MSTINKAPNPINVEESLNNELEYSETDVTVEYPKVQNKIGTVHNEIVSVKQKVGMGNIWRKRSMKDGIIDWRMSAEGIYNLIRALGKPYVGACFEYNDDKITVWRANIIKTDDYRNIEPGKVIKKYSNTDKLVLL